MQLQLLVLVALAGILLLHRQALVVVVEAAHCVCPQSTPPPTITDQFENAASVFRGTLLEIHPNDDDDEFPYVVLYASEIFKGHRSTSTTIIPTVTNNSSSTTIEESSSGSSNQNNNEVTNNVDEKQEANDGSKTNSTATAASSSPDSTSWFKRYEATLQAESTNVDRKVYTKRGSCGIVQWFDPKYVGKEFLVYTTFVENEDDQDGLIDSLNDVPTGSVLDGITSTSTNMEDLKSSQQIVENSHNDNHNDREEDSQRYNSRDREIVEEGTPITNNVFGVDIQMIDNEFSSTTSTATITIPKKKIRREWSIVCDGTKEILPDEEQQQQQPSVTEASSTSSNGSNSETIDSTSSGGEDNGSIEDFVEAGNLDDDATTSSTESMLSSNENNPINSENNKNGTNNDDNNSDLISSSTHTPKVLPPFTTNVDDELNELMWVALEETFPDCLQKKAEECRSIIQTKRPDLAVELILVSKSEQTPAASLLDQTLDLGRVRVYVNHDITVPADMLNNNAATGAASTTTTTSNQLPAVKIPGSDVPFIETPAAPVQQQEGGESQTQDAAVQSASSSDGSPSSNGVTTTTSSTSSETSTTQSSDKSDSGNAATTSMATTATTNTIPKRPPSLWRHIWDVIRYGRQEDIPLLGVIEYKDTSANSATKNTTSTTTTTTASTSSSSNNNSTVVSNEQQNDSTTNSENQESKNTNDDDSSSEKSETNNDSNNVDDTTPASNTNDIIVEAPSESLSTADPTKRLEDAYVIHIPFVG